MPLYPKALGPFTRPISSAVPEAQAYSTRAPRADMQVAAGVWAFGHGYARLNAGDAAAARAHLDRLRSAAQTDARFRFHDASDRPT